MFVQELRYMDRELWSVSGWLHSLLILLISFYSHFFLWCNIQRWPSLCSLCISPERKLPWEQDVFKTIMEMCFNRYIVWIFLFFCRLNKNMKERWALLREAGTNIMPLTLFECLDNNNKKKTYANEIHNKLSFVYQVFLKWVC